jgi:hypothetical protein
LPVGFADFHGIREQLEHSRIAGEHADRLTPIVLSGTIRLAQLHLWSCGIAIASIM